MQARTFSATELLHATLPVLGNLLLIWGVIAIGKAALFRVFGFTGASAVLVALMFGALFFSAPLAVSALRTRRRIRVFSRPGRQTLMFCFIWGGIAVAMFIGFLQLTQDMLATPMDYGIAMLAGGVFCSLTASIPNRS